MIIRELAEQWQYGLATSLTDTDAAEKFIIEATQEYRTWGRLQNEAVEFDEKQTASVELLEDIDGDTDLNPSEWGVVKHLAELFLERESALIQEASRVAGHEVYGRTVSEITQDIQNYRTEYLPKRAFSFPPCTI